MVEYNGKTVTEKEWKEILTLHYNETRNIILEGATGKNTIWYSIMMLDGRIINIYVDYYAK